MHHLYREAGFGNDHIQGFLNDLVICFTGNHHAESQFIKEGPPERKLLVVKHKGPWNTNRNPVIFGLLCIITPQKLQPLLKIIRYSFSFTFSILHFIFLTPSAIIERLFLSFYPHSSDLTLV